MSTRVRLKIGDVLEVPLAEGKVGYVQYIADDTSMLDSYVIRVFHGEYDATKAPEASDVVSSDVAFYAHVFLKLCIKYGHWKKVGSAPVPGRIDVLFRGCWDYGNSDIKVSRRWYIWRINEPFRDIGALTLEYEKAEIGSVLPYLSIVERMLTGSYTLGLPG
jgi:Immunity protein 26